MSLVCLKRHRKWDFTYLFL